MRISKSWHEFEHALSTAPEDEKTDILLSAALKKKYEIEREGDISLDDNFPSMLILQSARKKYGYDQQLKFIRRFDFEEMKIGS